MKRYNYSSLRGIQYSRPSQTTTPNTWSSSAPASHPPETLPPAHHPGPSPPARLPCLPRTSLSYPSLEDLSRPLKRHYPPYPDHPTPDPNFVTKPLPSPS